MKELYKKKKSIQEKIDFWVKEYEKEKNKDSVYFVRINKNLLNNIDEEIKKKKMEMMKK